MKIPWTFLENLIDAILIQMMNYHIPQYTWLHIFVMMSILCKTHFKETRLQEVAEENNGYVQVGGIMYHGGLQLLKIQILLLILSKVDTDALMDSMKEFMFVRTAINTLPLIKVLRILYVGSFIYNLFYGCYLSCRFMYFCTTVTYKYLMSNRSN